MSHIQVPVHPPIARFDDWELFQLQRPEFGSPLWIELKLANRARARAWGQSNVYRLCWGVDAKRLRRGKACLELGEREPALFEAVVRFLAATFTPERLEVRIGAPALAAERARLAELQSPARRAERAADRAEKRAVKERRKAERLSRAIAAGAVPDPFS